jgi:hypothetical protein
MIGYIQENDIDHWLCTINGWIKKLINDDSDFWNEDDCLRKVIASKCDRYTSTHGRKNGLSSIILFHFWIEL